MMMDVMDAGLQDLSTRAETADILEGQLYKSAKIHEEAVNNLMASHEKEISDLRAQADRKLKDAREELEISYMKDLSDIKSKADEELRLERGNLKKSLGLKIYGLETQLAAEETKREKDLTASNKRYGQLSSQLTKSQEDASTWETRHNDLLAKSNIVDLDYQATCTALEDLKVELKKTAGEKNAKIVALEQDIAVIRSKRTNPQVEEDMINRAVEDAKNKAKKEAGEVQAKMENLQKTHIETQAKLAQAESRLGAQKAELVEAWGLVNGARSNLIENYDHIASLEDQLAAALHNLRVAEGQSHRHEDEIKERTEECEKLGRDVRSLAMIMQSNAQQAAALADRTVNR
ncbi:hypothetical protein LZ554_007536 [Drepanopeziza brunnea f. sp. 'monogermtubi']|nr:hypothetical protein LZ554_007536 [Drepanopeziza brunnea f. sp. 'monogermtubi']